MFSIGHLKPSVDINDKWSNKFWKDYDTILKIVVESDTNP